MAGDNSDNKITVKLPVSGQPRGQKKWPLMEVKNVVFVCGWEHDQVSAYELRGVHLREVSVSGGSTVCIIAAL